MAHTQWRGCLPLQSSSHGGSSRHAALHTSEASCMPRLACSCARACRNAGIAERQESLLATMSCHSAGRSNACRCRILHRVQEHLRDMPVAEKARKLKRMKNLASAHDLCGELHFAWHAILSLQPAGRLHIPEHCPISAVLGLRQAVRVRDRHAFCRVDSELLAVTSSCRAAMVTIITHWIPAQPST